MEIKNLFNKQAQADFGLVKEGVKRKLKPLTDLGQQAGAEISREFSPVVNQVKNLATDLASPVAKPIQEAKQQRQAIGEINSFFTDAGINMEDIKALADEEGVDFNEVVDKFSRNGIKIEGMDSLIAQQEQEAQTKAEQPTDFSGRGLAINPEYDQVNALGNLASNIPKFQSQEDDSTLTSIGKMVGNLPSNAVQVGAGIGDIGLSYLRNLDQGPIDSLTETAKAKIINPTYQQALGIADTAKKGYEKGKETEYSWNEGGPSMGKLGVVGGVLGATDALTKKGTEFVVENPVATIGMVQGVKNLGRGKDAIKTAVSDVKSGNIGKATAGLAKSTGIGLKENIYDPIKMGVTAPITAVKLGAKGIGAIAKKTGIKAPEGVKNISNNMAEKMLASQWKLTKPIRKELEGKIGQSGPKFALENDLVGKDIESTADNAGKFKIDKIKEKIEAVKTFGETETPSVAKNVAQVLKSDIESSVQKSYGKKNIQKVLDENHPELANVYRLANEIMNSDKIDFVKLEQLKELHDYLNPENIQYDISGKPISETRNILSAGKRQKLQQILEAEGQKRGIDIKKINRDIQGAYTLEKGLNDTVGRIANLNILGLGDTQTAVISSILGGAPGAVGGILLKKGLTSEGFVGGLAKSLYSKKDVTTNNSNPSGAMTPPVTRLGRIMNNSSDTVTPKVEPKGVTPKVVKPSSTTPTKPKDSIVTPKKKEVTPIVKKEVNLGLSEEDALYLYTDQKYKDINKALRSGDTTHEMVKLIDSAISKNETDRAIRVYRGVDKNNLKSILKKQENGDIIYSDKAYLSTSMSPSVAKNFSDGYILEINLPKGTKYAKNPVSEKEMEFILERGKSYKVISQRKEGANTILSIEPIKPSPKPIVKNLQKTEKSATIGDMETKKLIEEARKAKSFAEFFMSKLGDKEVNKKNLLKIGISSEQIERNTFSNGISLEDIFYELKSGKLSSYPIK